MQVTEAKRPRTDTDLNRTVTAKEDAKSLRPNSAGAVGKFFQQSLPSTRLRPHSPLFAGPLLLICGLVMTILGALMMVGLDGKVEYIIQYDGIPMNPLNQSEPSLTTWGGNVAALEAGFSKHRNVRERRHDVVECIYMNKQDM